MVARKRLHTLKRSWQFRFCYSGGGKVVCQYAVIFYRSPPEGGTGLQVGVVASRRVGNAVVRSRAKRLLREAARQFSDLLNDRNMWIVLVAKASIVDSTSRDVRDDIEHGLGRAGLLERTS